MNHRVTNLTQQRVALTLGGRPLALEPGASTEVDVSEYAAVRLARHRVLGFEKIAPPPKLRFEPRPFVHSEPEQSAKSAD